MGVQVTGRLDLMDHAENDPPGGRTDFAPSILSFGNWSTFTLYKKRFLDPVYINENGYQVFRIR
jgi:hypothetical protein